MKRINRNEQIGMSLVELMISMLLGLMLLGGVLQFFVSSKRTFVHTELFGKMEENGRFALEFIAGDIRMAGYADPNISAMPKPISGGCDEGNVWCSRDGQNLGSDRIAIHVDPSNDQDCNGNAVDSSAIVINAYWVEQGENNIPTLFCQGYDADTKLPLSGSQALIEGIETLQVLYGVKASSAAQQPAQYVSAGEVSNWHFISAVKISVLTQSGSGSEAHRATRSFSVLDSGPFEYTDGIPRTLYSTTVVINNAI